MRRSLLLVPLLAAALLPTAPANAAAVVCARHSGNAACTPSVVCRPGVTIRVTVVGVGKGEATCGDAYATCVAFRGFCTGEDTPTTGGFLTCLVTNSATATCSASVTFK